MAAIQNNLTDTIAANVNAILSLRPLLSSSILSLKKIKRAITI